MTLHFSIEYRTEWGQSVEVELSFLSADGKTTRQYILLETDDGVFWKGVFRLKSRSSQFRYTYIITASHQSQSRSTAAEGEDARGVIEGGRAVLRREWDVVPRLFPVDDNRTYFFLDHWRDRPASSYCYTDAFRISSGIAKKPAVMPALFPRTCLFRIQAPQLQPGERVALLGDQPALGNWDVARALPMMPSSNGEWLLSISGDGLRLPFQYKYIKVGKDHSVHWEEGPNRQSPEHSPKGVEGGGCVVALSDGELRLPSPRWKVAGLVVPLFSLRSEGSQGVGDFGDLCQICDWAASTGMHAVQLLPIYDTTQNRTPTDSYPYNAISVHALHPIYADLRRLPLADAEALASFRERWQKLNALPAIDYVEVIKMKEEYLHLLYEEQTASSKSSPASPKSSPKGKDFPPPFREEMGAGFSFREGTGVGFEGVGESDSWLLPYQVFCHLRDTYGTARFAQWPKLSAYNQSAVQRYAERHAHEIGYYAFVQNILHQQLSEAAEHARRLRVFLKGDLPIGISPNSVEAWQSPHLFHTDMAAGAPPDDFSATGQNWGFPTYDWERMAADGYQWWKQRLRDMSKYFGAYRIDHILGFFRIWQIPRNSPTALLGQFSPALPMSVAEIESYGMPLVPELFVPDATRPDLYHPRIGVIGEKVWCSLPKYEQDAFIRLYEDFFFRRHNNFWAEQAMHRLPVLVDATDMLVCGEDLGMVPDCVGPVMQHLGILSLEIQAMPKAYGVRFSRLSDNPYRSVATIFTHDMPTLRLWWKEDAERTRLYYNEVLEHDGPAPDDLPGWLQEEIVAHHLNCPSMLCLISLQDWISMDESLRNPHPEEERINVPANPKHYWRYRMHIPISRLLAADALNDRLRTLIARSGRECLL